MGNYRLYPNTKLFQLLFPKAIIKGKYLLVKLEYLPKSEYFTEMNERTFYEYTRETIKEIVLFNSYKRNNLPELLRMLSNSDILISRFPCKESEDFRNYILTKIDERCNKV